MTAPPSSIGTYLFADDGKTPNHPRFPVLLLRGTPAAEADDPAAWLESRFPAHGWGACWRWTVYDYDHFHPDNHEVLGVLCGHAVLRLGGEHGAEVAVASGDVVILPAGTGHQCLQSSPGFQVVGAYPGSRTPATLRAGETPLPALRQVIAAVRLPPEDPVYGTGGPLCQYWKA